MIEIENVGICRDILDLVIIDFMEDCLEYANEAVVYYNGLPLGFRPPDSMTPTVGGTELVWDLSELEIGALAPGDTIAIEYYAIAGYPGINVNTVFGSAHCSYDYTNIVSDEDTVAVYVYEEQVVAEDVLYGDLYAEAYYECDQFLNCVYSEVYIDFYAEDISMMLGPYPVTNVVLYVNGGLVYNSGAISETYFSSFYDIYDAGCGVTYNLELVVTNSIGLTVNVFGSISVPPSCD